jgi:hypothetical protein
MNTRPRTPITNPRKSICPIAQRNCNISVDSSNKRYTEFPA